MRILDDDSMGLIIDVQEKIFPHMHEKENLLKRISILIQGLQLLDVPILVTEQYTRGLGYTIDPVRSLFHGFNPIEKISFSCCDEPLFNDQMKWMRKKYVIIAGIEAHICVQQTMEDLKEQGYLPVIIDDCVSSRRQSDKDIAIARMRQDGAIVTTSESILFEMCRHAGNERFKAIAGLIK
ncbi:MAG TPA: hydrolase [Bacteroidales bacterium]|nr:hydrolase [Bacteroidales bacterium]